MSVPQNVTRINIKTARNVALARSSVLHVSAQISISVLNVTKDIVKVKPIVVSVGV